MSKLTEEVKKMSRKLDNIDQRVEKIETTTSLNPIIIPNFWAGDYYRSFVEFPKSIPPPAPPEAKFKKGDWVRSLITGTVGKVEAFYEDGSPFRYLLSTIDSKKFTSHESQLEPYFPREGEYAYIECKSANKYIIIYDHLGIRGETNHVFDKATVRLDSKCFWTDERPLCGLNEITEIRPATVEEKKLLDSKLAENGLRFDRKKIVEDKTPKVGDFCIFWDRDKDKAFCAVLSCCGLDMDDHNAKYQDHTTGYWHANCVKFESEEQYKRVKEGK